MQHQIKKDKQEIELLLTELDSVLQKICEKENKFEKRTTITGKNQFFVQRQVEA